MKELQAKYQDFVDERPNLSKSPFFMQFKIHEEADELLAEMGDPAEMTPEQRIVLGDELADIFSFTMGIANVYGIDLAEAFDRKLAYNRDRFHPDETYEESKIREGRPIKEFDVYTPSISSPENDHFEA